MQVRESWKADLDCHGVRTERPYPPCSMKVSSSLRTSRMSRSSLAITVNLHSSIYLAAATAACVRVSQLIQQRSKARTTGPTNSLLVFSYFKMISGETYAGRCEKLRIDRSILYLDHCLSARVC